MGINFAEPYGIVFSGGGAHGAWEVGCLTAISKAMGRPPDVVTGASAGGMNAAGYASGYSDAELTDVWVNLKPTDVCRRAQPWQTDGRLLFAFLRALVAERSLAGAALRLARSRNSIFDTTRLSATLEHLFANRIHRLLASPTKLAITLSDLNAKESRVFFHAPGPLAAPEPSWKRITSFEDLRDALMGSTALPIFFPDYHYLFDGGVLQNSPVRPALKLGARFLFVLLPSVEAAPNLEDLPTIAGRLLRVWIDGSLLQQLEWVRLLNETVHPALGKRPIPVCCMRPTRDLKQTFAVGLLDFGTKNVAELITAGNADAEQRLSRFDVANPGTWY